MLCSLWFRRRCEFLGKRQLNKVPLITELSRSSGDLHFCLSVSRSPNKPSRMAFAIGSIMAVVAVLLSHMDRKDVVSIIPSMSLWKQFRAQSQISPKSIETGGDMKQNSQPLDVQIVLPYEFLKHSSMGVLGNLHISNRSRSAFVCVDINVFLQNNIAPFHRGVQQPSNKGVFSPCRFYSDNTEDLQGYSAMQAPLLNRRRHNKAAEEQKVGLDEVLRADLFGWKDSQCWEEADWKHCSDSQRKSLCTPKHSHQHHHVKTFSLLKGEQYAAVNASKRRFHKK